MEWQTVLGGSVWGGRVCMRDTHAHRTARTRRPGAGDREQREESSLAPLPAGTSTPSRGEDGDRDPGAAPPLPDCAQWAPDLQRFPVAREGVFVRVVLLAQAGWWAGRGQKRNLSPPEAGDQASKHTMQKCKPTGNTPTHSPTHSRNFTFLL